MSGMGSRRWRKVRARLLRREPLCRECAREGLTVAATEVDHVVPRWQGGAVFDEANLQPLCGEHHDRKTAREARERSGRRGATLAGDLA